MIIELIGLSSLALSACAQKLYYRQKRRAAKQLKGAKGAAQNEVFEKPGRASLSTEEERHVLPKNPCAQTYVAPCQPVFIQGTSADSDGQPALIKLVCGSGTSHHALLQGSVVQLSDVYRIDMVQQLQAQPQASGVGYSTAEVYTVKNITGPLTAITVTMPDGRSVYGENFYQEGVQLLPRPSDSPSDASSESGKAPEVVRSGSTPLMANNVWVTLPVPFSEETGRIRTTTFLSRLPRIFPSALVPGGLDIHL